jgi:hypothetical protein
MVRGISLHVEMGCGFFLSFVFPSREGLALSIFLVPAGCSSFGLSLAFPFF